MKKYITCPEPEYIFGMCNLVPKDTRIPADIWSEHKGVSRHKKDKTPGAKVSKGDSEVSVSIEPKPKILARSKSISHSDMKAIKKGIEYIGKNYDLFLDHFNDIDDNFTDLDLMKALASRGDFKL